VGGVSSKTDLAPQAVAKGNHVGLPIQDPVVEGLAAAVCFVLVVIAFGGNIENFVKARGGSGCVSYFLLQFH